MREEDLWVRWQRSEIVENAWVARGAGLGCSRIEVLFGRDVVFFVLVVEEVVLEDGGIGGGVDVCSFDGILEEGIHTEKVGVRSLAEGLGGWGWAAEHT